MPRTRSKIDRDTKISQILEAAEQRLRKGSYEALSMAGISRDLGVAQNAIYWYFPSKDHLLVATLKWMFMKPRAPSRKAGLVDSILDFIEELKELHRVRAVMDERSASSPVVAAFARDVDQHMRTRLADALRPHVPPSELSVAVDMFVATAQGVCGQEIDARARRAVLRFALERIMNPSRKAGQRRKRKADAFVDRQRSED